MYPEAQYTTKNFEEFYELAEQGSVPIFGKFTVIVKTDNLKDIMTFINKESQYGEFIVLIYTTDTIVEQVCLRRPHANVQGSKSDYDVFVDLIEKHGILFKQGVAETLYRSIDHSFAEMDALLLNVKLEFGLTEVTEQMIQQMVVLNKLIYPRTVVMELLFKKRWRMSKVRKCVEQLGNDVVFWSMRKTIKKLMKDKSAFLETGVGREQTKRIDYKNLLLLYRVFCSENTSLRDVELLAGMYEEGVNVNDIIQERSFPI